MGTTVQAFTPDEFAKAKVFLATQVAEMMGRKFEEGDWAKVYCAAKGIPESAWSNLDIDVMAGSVGVEHKMLCRKDHRPILDAAGTSLMHPAGTRSLRVPPGIENPTEAAREILRQYGQLIDDRGKIVRTVSLYHHQRLDRLDAAQTLAELKMGVNSIAKLLPAKLQPVGDPDADLDMRTGWLLWQQSLREFLYFEEKMEKPIPEDYTATWNEREGGRRKASRNLWVYKDGVKKFSITNEAGVKLQPYFEVPLPTDSNLYHIIVQGEELPDGLIRVWLTEVTAELLRSKLGGLAPNQIAQAIDEAVLLYKPTCHEHIPFQIVAFELLVPKTAYERLRATYQGVSDEHNFKQLVDTLNASDG